MPLASLVPLPENIEMLPGVFCLKDGAPLRVGSQAACQETAGQLAGYLRLDAGLVLKPRQGPGGVRLALDKSKPGLGPEGYLLDCGKTGVKISAPAPAGLFHGIQTLRQLLVPIPGSPAKAQVPCLRIQDRPRFSWRGLMLDCCRHMLSLDFIKLQLDLLAYHKLNVFHWHLTEDQGWRLEIKKYPRLASHSAWRREGGKLYGGYYTQDQAREIVEFAAQRHIQVIPEIEMPGHCQAALAAFPELSCVGGPFEVGARWGIFDDVYCAGREEVFEFLQNVLSEVVDIFPSPIIHLGADECHKDRWKNCPRCQERMRREGLKDEDQLQSWFLKRISRFLTTKKRRIMGWDEMVEGGLPEGAVVQWWLDGERARTAARQGHMVVASPMSHAYLDYSHERISMRHLYSFKPEIPGLNPRENANITGVEAPMWTEYTPQDAVESYIYPRLCALAEMGWTPQTSRQWEDFAGRMDGHLRRLRRMGVDYHDPGIPVGGWQAGDFAQGKAALVMDISQAILEPGACQVSLQALEGPVPFLEWGSVSQDGAEIAGFSARSRGKMQFAFQVAHPGTARGVTMPGDKFVLKLALSGAAAGACSGRVFVKALGLKENNRFYAA